MSVKKNLGTVSKKEEESIRTELWEKYYQHPDEFLHEVLKGWFPKEIPWVHLGIIAILSRRTDFLLKYSEKILNKLVSHFVYSDNEEIGSVEEELPMFSLIKDETGKIVSIDLIVTKNTLIMLPRGFSKTTLANGLVIWMICYQEREFLVYLSETQLHANSQLGNIKKQLEENEDINFIFGTLKPEQRSGKTWREDKIETTTGIFVKSRGRGGQIRGSNEDAKRPDFILFDDVEDTESVLTPEQRSKTLDWMLADVMPALPAMNEDACLLGLGTLLHNEALLQKLRTDTEFTSVVFGAMDRDGEPLWADLMGLDKIAKMKKKYAKYGKLHLFYMEYFNTLRNDDIAIFKSSYLQYKRVDLKEIPHRALVLDPAISEKKGSDFVGYAVVGMGTDGFLHVLDTYAKVGMKPREQVDKFFELSDKWGITEHGIETIAFQKALVHLMQEEMFRRGKYFEIHKIDFHATNKITRIKGILQPRYAAGYIFHRRVFGEYEMQLLDFPNGKKDLPDAVAMATSLLDPFAAYTADPEAEWGQDEFEPLDRLFGGDSQSFY